MTTTQQSLLVKPHPYRPERRPEPPEPSTCQRFGTIWNRAERPGGQLSQTKTYMLYLPRFNFVMDDDLSDFVEDADLDDLSSDATLGSR